MSRLVVATTAVLAPPSPADAPLPPEPQAAVNYAAATQTTRMLMAPP